MSPRPDFDLVIIRHGESEWNRKNLFTGWRDVDLTDTGEAEAKSAGVALKEAGFVFDVAHVSMLRRAIKTLWLVLEKMDLMWIPIHNHWRLNERHYGKLQGDDKVEAVKRFGEEQVKIWRRSYDIPPPPVDVSSPDYPKHDPRYAHLSEKDLPKSESLKEVLERVMPYWENVIVPDLKAGKKVLIAAHGNSLRALLKHLEGVGDADIVEVNIPTGVPKVYKLNKDFKAEKTYFLGDQAAIEAKIKAVASQTKK